MSVCQREDLVPFGDQNGSPPRVGFSVLYRTGELCSKFAQGVYFSFPSSERVQRVGRMRNQK